jgi:hypothetical protein
MDQQKFSEWLIPFLFGLSVGFGVAWRLPHPLLLLVVPIVLLVMIAMKYLLGYHGLGTSLGERTVGNQQDIGSVLSNRMQSRRTQRGQLRSALSLAIHLRGDNAGGITASRSGDNARDLSTLKPT